MEELREKHNDTYRDIHGKQKDLIETSRGLRRLAAKVITTSEDEVFMNVLMNLKVDENTPGWSDAWSPTDEIIRSNLDALADPNVTRVNGLDFDSELISCQLSNNDEVVHHVPNLSIHFAALKERVENQLSRPGHVHWGTYTDVMNLSNALEIGFIVFPSAQLGWLENAGWVYSISNTRADFSHWMILYCVGLRHFQLAVLQQDQAPSQSVFLLDEVPGRIRHQYNINNKDMPMGRRESRGFV